MSESAREPSGDPGPAQHRALSQTSGLTGRIVVLVILGAAVILMATMTIIAWVWGVWGK